VGGVGSVVSVCLTVYNEEGSIERLIESLLSQMDKKDELVIVDGYSQDGTIGIIKNLVKKEKRIRLYVKRLTRSEGRNFAVKEAKNEIIAMTDAGCIAVDNWLKRITTPLVRGKTEVVAGFYRMSAKNAFEKAETTFLGVSPNKFSSNYLPSTRSIAFNKAVWKKVGGFPEALEDTAEDTVFNARLIRNNVRISRVKDAKVEWGMPGSMEGFIKKIYSYAKGDALSGIWKHPLKSITSHNIKAASILVRYILAIVIVALFFGTSLFWIPVLMFLIYSCWAFQKVYDITKSFEAGLWGIVLQYISDICVMSGLLSGIYAKVNSS
jgi:glycosyltransferase involved in cell wall biosynthesis